MWLPGSLHLYRVIIRTARWPAPLQFGGSTSVIPETWRLLGFIFLTACYFLPSKLQLFWCPRMRGLNAQPKDASNLMSGGFQICLPSSLCCCVSRLSPPYVTLVAVYTLLGNFIGKSLLKIFILGFCNCFKILI